MKHKWNKVVNDKGEIEEWCLCGVERKRKSWKLRMAIVGSRDYYQYGTAMAYRKPNEKWRFERPQCNRLTEKIDV